MRRITWLFTVSALGFTAGGNSASAYVREVTSTGLPIAWHTPCVTMHFRLDAPPPVLNANEIVEATTHAMAAWSYPQIADTDIRLGLVVETQVASSAGYDRKNVILFRQDDWCHVADADAGTGETECYPPSALAVTSIFKNTKTGEILDADIEFNAVHFDWGDLLNVGALVTPSTADFQNALTHELGHVVGLDHNCYTTNDGPTRLNDNQGVPAIDCYIDRSELPDDIANATMYPSVGLSDTDRRTLSPDDELGVREIYPHIHDVCPPPPSDAGCRLAGVPAPARRAWPEILGVLVLLACAALSARRSPR